MLGSNERKNLDTAHFGQLETSLQKNFLSFDNNTNGQNQALPRFFKSTGSSIPNNTGNFNSRQSNADKASAPGQQHELALMNEKSSPEETIEDQKLLESLEKRIQQMDQLEDDDLESGGGHVN